MNNSVAIIFMIITLLILISGILIMAIGGKINSKFSNKLMSLRVLFQSLTIIIFAFIAFITKK